MTRPIAVLIALDTQTALTQLSKVLRTTLAEQVRIAVDSYVLERLSNPNLEQEIEEAKSRFDRSLNVLTNADTHTDPPSTQKFFGPSGKQVSLRLGQIALMRLTSLAVLDDNSVADQLRSAFDRYVSLRMGEQEIQDGLTALSLLTDVDELSTDSAS